VIASSGDIKTPDSTPSDNIDPEWAVVDESFSGLEVASTGGPSSSDLARSGEFELHKMHLSDAERFGIGGSSNFLGSSEHLGSSGNLVNGQ
jgi:hypothetical protein